MWRVAMKVFLRSDRSTYSEYFRQKHKYVKAHTQPRRKTDTPKPHTHTHTHISVQWLSQGYFNNPQHVCLMVRAQQEMIGK